MDCDDFVVYGTEGVFLLEESLESLENDWILLCTPHSGGSPESIKKSLSSLEPLEN